VIKPGRRLNVKIAMVSILAAAITMVSTACLTEDVRLGRAGGEIGEGECDPAACGPAPGVPNEICADGTIAGPTGKCLDIDGMTCGWEILSCGGGPAAGCDVNACGPAPGMPNEICADGTIGGPVCQPDANGVCAWAIIECGDPPLCDEMACGPKPGAPNEVCPDGTIGGPACQPDASGICAWVIIECGEPSPCDEMACGPEPAMPAVCPDGTIVGYACDLDASGMCAWMAGLCPE
jgi:hypothetical protein